MTTSAYGRASAEIPNPRSRIAAIDFEIARLREARDRAVADLVSDLDFMGVTVLQAKVRFLHESGEVHLVEQMDEQSGYVRLICHRASECDHLWCGVQGTPQRTKHARRGRGHIHVFLGPHEVISRDEDVLTCIPARRERVIHRPVVTR